MLRVRLCKLMCLLESIGELSASVHGIPLFEVLCLALG
jgi:hypothetical protein